MKLTDSFLSEKEKLFRYKNQWIFEWLQEGILTKFIIEKEPYNTTAPFPKIKYKLILRQQLNSLFLGYVDKTNDLEDLFSSITRGEYL